MKVKEPAGIIEDSMKHTTIIQDSIIAGVLGSMKDSDSRELCEVTPINDVERDKVVYHISGDIDALMKALYENRPVGALDVLRSIKSARSAIFNMRRR